MEGLLRRSGLDQYVEIDSAGTHDHCIGKPPFDHAVRACVSRGFAVANRSARTIRPGDFDHFDMMLAMDRGNLLFLRKICPTRSKHKIELLSAYGEFYHGLDVSDPFGHDKKAYDRALDVILDGCLGLTEFLRSQIDSRTGRSTSI